MSSQNNNFTAYFNAFNFPLLVFSPLFLSYFNSMTSFQPKSERPNNSTLMSCYERRFNLNLDFIKEKYRKQINQVLSFSEVLKATIKLEKKVEKENIEDLFPNKIYCFLCSLAFYEIDSQITHDQFNEENWDKFAGSLNFFNKEDVFFLKNEIFKKNVVNYKWSVQEDQILTSLISKHQFCANKSNKILWKKVAFELSKSHCSTQIRTSSHCQERWKNSLSKKYKKGDWTIEEDRKIIGFVLADGNKWSKLARLCEGRTEHNMKNRFFGLLSKHLSIPIKKIKTSKNYNNQKILNKILIEMEI